MKSRESISELEPTTQIDWGEYQNFVFIEDIETLGINPVTTRNIYMGQLYEDPTYLGIETLASERFRECSALIIRDCTDNHFTLAHITPSDFEIFYKLNKTRRNPSEALLIYGSSSHKQPLISDLLTKEGTEVNTLYVETGKSSFDIALEVYSGEVSIVRRDPDYSILKYDPFNLSQKKAA